MTMKTYHVPVLACALALTFFGFAPKKIQDVADVVRFADYKTFPAPREGCGPGYVFRISKKDKRTQIPVTQLSADDIHSGKVALSETNSTVKGSSLLKFLSPGSTVDATVSGSSTATLALSFGQGYIETLDEALIEERIKAKKIQFKSDSKYYAIIETIAVDSMSFVVKELGKKSAGVTATIDQYVAQGQFSRDKDVSTRLIKAFTPRHRVFYKVVEVIPSGSGLATDVGPRILRVQGSESLFSADGKQ